MFFNFYSNMFNCLKSLKKLVKSNVRYRYQKNVLANLFYAR